MNSRRPYAAFTLLELLTVIAIIGILAALVAPMLTQFRKGDAITAATNQLLGDVARARQLAISQRTTVYMVFVPTNFWNTPSGTFNDVWSNSLTAVNPALQAAVINVSDKQLTGYTYFSMRTTGDQPGRNNPRYLSEWRTLPDSIFIAQWKFNPFNPQIPAGSVTDLVTGKSYSVYGFATTNNIPFPTADSPPSQTMFLPYIAFNYLGQLISDTNASGNYMDAYIPLAHGSVLPARNPATKTSQVNSPQVSERPPGNSTNSYNLIHIDWLTGRARLEHQEVQ